MGSIESMTLKRELDELKELKNKCFSRGVYATHLLIHSAKENDDVAFFTRIKGDPEDTFYMMHAFGEKASFAYKEIRNGSEYATLIPLGEKGIPIHEDNYFEISQGEIWLCGKNNTERKKVELLISKL